jgi:hypothetical protein
MIGKRFILILSLAAAGIGGCAVDTDRPETASFEVQASVSAPNACIDNGEGCPCTDPDATTECQIKRQSGSYVTCSAGVRVCSNGKWSECLGDSVAGE